MSQYSYVGSELELFAGARNWKNYLGVLLKPHLNGNILEVGAGIGSNTRFFHRPQSHHWVCLEPDRDLFQSLKATIQSYQNCDAVCGTLDDLDRNCKFDCILYIDVLEHIEGDREEVLKAIDRLKYGGKLIIVGPAHQWLFTPFDEAIGHYRRYTKSMVRELIPVHFNTIQLNYLDCVGLCASLANKLILKQSQPSVRQIQTWDRLMVPISKTIDPLLGYNLGKSILFVGQKNFD